MHTIKKLLPLLLLGCLPVAFAGAQNIKRVEYFYDSDPGFGKGTTLPATFTPASDVTVSFVDSSAAFKRLNDGLHRIFVRSWGDSGWSVTNTTYFYKQALTALPNITRAEYFIDNNDKGFGNNTVIPIATGLTDVNSLAFTTNIQGLAEGLHRLFVRSQDSYGRWAVTNNTIFYKVGVDSVPTLTRLEWFVDKDPGFGAGYAIKLNPTKDTTIKAIDISMLPMGKHVLFVRALDAKGHWGITNTTDTIVTKTTALPVTLVSFTAALQGENSVLTKWQTATEVNTSYFQVERSIDGFGFTAIGRLPAKGNSAEPVNYSFADEKLPLGAMDLYYRLRVVDKNGNIAYSPVVLLKLPGNSLQFSMYPNPARQYTTLHFGGMLQKAFITVYNAAGSQVFGASVNVSGGSYQLSTQNLPAGVYLVVAKTNNSTYKQKLVVVK